ncbi:MFS transporter [Streptomyces sp. NPDC006997]|uniref:MFS transporter n=1 Tax=Streptomyces sp. NPDC006997 TaxID=3155356 RepID=UPI0033C587CD
MSIAPAEPSGGRAAWAHAVLAPLLTPRLVARYGSGRVILGGCLLAVVAYGLFLPVGMDWPYAAMFPSLVVAGTAFACAYGPLSIAATGSVAEEEQGLAGGLLHTFTQFGSAVGTSAVTAVYGIASAGGAARRARYWTPTARRWSCPW